MADLLQAAAPSLFLLAAAILVLPQVSPGSNLGRLIGQGYRIWNFRVLNRGRRLGFRPLWSSLGRRDGFVRRKLGLRGSNAIALAHRRGLHCVADRPLPALARDGDTAIAGGDLKTVVSYGFFAIELLASLASLLLLHVLSSFRVWVLDDLRRPWLRELCAELGAGYLTRGDNLHGKAGNMNAALQQVIRLPQPPDAIAVLDADFVARPHFLRRAAALLHDPEVGVVQTPQFFFNPDPIQLNLAAQRIIPDEQRFFFDCILASKDAHGTAFSCGTSALVRVAALEAIGGFPTESVTEDLLLSIKLTGVGWRTVYLNEPLSAGLAPEGLHEYLTQRGRWCLGTMQIMRTKWGPLSAGPTPIKMRLHTLDAVLFWTVAPLFRLLALLAPIFYWWFGLVVMEADLPSILLYLGPYWISCITFLAWVSRGTNLPVLAEAMSYLTLPWHFKKASEFPSFRHADEDGRFAAARYRRGS
jgi:cellulose synthase (UDP-forming)